MNMKAEKREREKKENCDFFFEAASVAPRSNHSGWTKGLAPSRRSG